MTHRYFGGVVPEPGILDSADAAELAAVDGALDEAAGHLTAVRLRAALASLLAAAQATNQYLSEKAPWLTARDDEVRTRTTLFVALQALSGLAAGFAPYLPLTSRRVLQTLGVDGGGRQPPWGRAEVRSGTEIGPAEPLFAKVDRGVDRPVDRPVETPDDEA
jgi:methionyl-tRNA synthetase